MENSACYCTLALGENTKGRRGAVAEDRARLKRYEYGPTMENSACCCTLALSENTKGRREAVAENQARLKYRDTDLYFSTAMIKNG